MLVASVTTIIFNANPLLRYDGYYILSDWLEIPNLRQKSQEYSLGLIKRHVFRVKQQQPLPPLVQRFWLLAYYVTSGIYRIFVGIMIILLVAFEIPILGILMAIGGLVTWICMPVFKVFKYLTIEPELHRKRGRATAFVLAVTALVVVSVGVIKFPLRLYATGVAEPAIREVVRAGTPGFVERVVAKDGQWVKPGDLILVMRSGELDAELEAARAQLRAAEAERDKVLAKDPGLVGSAVQKIRIYQVQITDLLDRKNRLTVRSTIEGQVASPHLHELVGQFLPNGQEVALVMQPDELVVHTALQQDDAEPVLSYADVRTKVRFAGDIAGEWAAGKPRAGGADSDLRPALSQLAGGEAPADPQDPNKAAIPVFDVMIPLTNPKDAAHPRGRFVPYQRAHVQFVLDHKPLIWQWSRRFYQLIQENAAGSKWL